MRAMIVVGGEALVDLIVHADGRFTAAAGGGPYNTARTIGRLGQAVAFVGGLSDDRFGTMLRDRLIADGVDVGLALPTGMPTTLAVAELDSDGVATYRFYTAGTSAVALDVARLPAFAPATVRAIHVGTLGLVLDPLADAMESLVDGAPDEAVVMVDPNGRPSATPDLERYVGRVDRILRRADVVKVSTDDLAMLRPGRPPAEAVSALLAAGPAVVLWTDGAAPVRVVTRDGTASVPTPSVMVADTVGAGDAFGGGFLASWVGAGHGRATLGAKDAHEALLAATHEAVRVAAITCTRRGAEPPTAAELERSRL